MNRRVLNDDTVLIKAGWTLDNNNAHEMVEAIMAAQADGHRYVIIDMRDLQFLSSAGVGAIIGTVETNREIGGDIILCHLSREVLHVLTVLDLDSYLTIMPDVDEAMDRCAAKS